MEDSLQLRWSKLADRLGQTGVDILAGAPITVTEKKFKEPKILAIMLMSRTLSNFRGVFTLIENGLVVEARILVRCCFENAFWIAGLVSHGDEFVTEMFKDEIKSRRTRAEMVLSKKAELSEQATKRLQEQLRATRKKWPDAETLSPKGVAFRGLLKEGYLTYCQLSADAAHPTLTSLHRHVGHADDDDEAIIEVVPIPKDEEVVMTWSWACNAMLGACVAVNQILGGTPAGQTLEHIADCYQTLNILTFKQSASPMG
jgi:hypothetical protein